MSYSFAVKAATAAAALAAAAVRLDEEIARQPIHAKDRAEALANVEKHLALIRDPREGEEVNVTMYGSCYGFHPEGGGAGPADVVLECAGSGCSVSVAKIPTPA